MIEYNPQTYQITLTGAQQSTYESIVERINKVMDSIKFFESLPPNELLDLIKQQMEKHSVHLSIVNAYHTNYLNWYDKSTTIGPITQACQILWEIITELESKCKNDITNKQQ